MCAGGGRGRYVENIMKNCLYQYYRYSFVLMNERTTTQLGCCLRVLLTAYPFLDPGLNEKIFTDTAGSAMMDTPGKN